MPLQQLGISERTFLLLTSTSLHLGAQPMIQDPLDSVSFQTGLFSHNIQADSSLPSRAGMLQAFSPDLLSKNITYHLSAIILKPWIPKLLAFSGLIPNPLAFSGHQLHHSSAPQGDSCSTGSSLVPSLHSKPSPPAVFAFTFSTAPDFHPLIDNFPGCPASREIHCDL